ncbi:MAG: enoyl-CoA hydratase/isomerase family protein [bacterium]|nr:enoyl-CoA hydratase/isomerase family protein [bacterium]
MDYEQVRLEIADGVATLTLYRPERRNGWTRQMGAEFRDALGRCERDDAVRVVVVTGAGRDFCVGADLERGGRVFQQAAAARQAGEARRPLRAWEMRKPLVAALNGTCAGVGATLPLQMDIRIAGASTRIGFVFVRRGLVPENACTWILPRLVGLSVAADLLLTGRLVGADEARDLGLVSRVVPDDEVLATAQALARDIARETAPVAVALTKRLLWCNAGEPDAATAEARDARAFAWATQSADAREGLRAFAEKRTPQWTLSPSTDLPALDEEPWEP